MTRSTSAVVDETDLERNRERYARESLEKLPATKSMYPPKPVQRLFGWYFTRIYVHVRPERVWVWRGDAEPELLDTHLEEVRSGHDEEPDAPHAGPVGRAPVWDGRIQELDSRYESAVLSIVAPDGFPFSARVGVRLDPDGRRIAIDRVPAGVPLQPGLACLAAHDHEESFKWQRNFQVRGDLVEDGDGWALVPAKLIGGFEIPPGGPVQQVRANLGKVRRFRRIAKRELAKRG